MDPESNFNEQKNNLLLVIETSCYKIEKILNRIQNDS